MLKVGTYSDPDFGRLFTAEKNTEVECKRNAERNKLKSFRLLRSSAEIYCIFSALKKSTPNSYYRILFSMFTRIIILLGVFFLISYFSLAQDYQHFFNEAKKALGEKRYQEYYTLD
jgi:hypothetical protein